MPNHEGKPEQVDPENIKEILSVVSSEIPAMIKSILSSVFSEEAGRNMGKAAAAYYKELKAGGLSEPVAVKMTENTCGLSQASATCLEALEKADGAHTEETK
jgi:hypothetical protein